MRLKTELKAWKESSVVNASQLEESLTDKEEEVRKLRRDWKDKEDQMIDQIKNLKLVVSKLKQELDTEAEFNDK